MPSCKFAATTLVACLTLLTSLSASADLAAGEPSFCDSKNFVKNEIESNMNGLQRNHAFQLGDLVVVGLAVGKSDVNATKALAQKFSQFSPEEKNCTWYFNDGNQEAQKAFNHRYVSNPSYKGPEIATEFENVLANSFSNDAVSFMSCLTEHKYLAMGCDGQKHRGPSVFAMFLAYAGCSPKNATAIANQIWGTNGVEVATREAIAAKGKLLGDRNPSLRNQLQVMMGVK